MVFPFYCCPGTACHLLSARGKKATSVTKWYGLAHLFPLAQLQLHGNFLLDYFSGFCLRKSLESQLVSQTKKHLFRNMNFTENIHYLHVPLYRPKYCLVHVPQIYCWYVRSMSFFYHTDLTKAVGSEVQKLFLGCSWQLHLFYHMVLG